MSQGDSWEVVSDYILNDLNELSLKETPTRITCCDLERLVIVKGALTDQQLADSLAVIKNSRITTLEFYGLDITDSMATVIAEILTDQSCQVQRLAFNCNNLNPTAMGILTAALSHPNNQVHFLGLNFNHRGISNKPLAVESVEHLTKLLKSKHCKLSELYLSGNQLGNNNATAILAATTQSKTMKVLTLTNENIAAVTLPQSNLESLNLSQNNIQGKAAVAVARSATTCGLKSLNLADNKIDTYTAIRLLDVLGLGKLSSLYLSKNNFDPEAMIPYIASSNLVQIDLGPSILPEEATSVLTILYNNQIRLQHNTLGNPSNTNKRTKQKLS